jgi:hypothetical protein
MRETRKVQRLEPKQGKLETIERELAFHHEAHKLSVKLQSSAKKTASNE